MGRDESCRSAEQTLTEGSVDRSQPARSPWRVMGGDKREVKDDCVMNSIARKTWVTVVGYETHDSQLGSSGTSERLDTSTAPSRTSKDCQLNLRPRSSRLPVQFHSQRIFPFAG